MKVRNERLYAFLKHFFKNVRVQNVGAPFRYRIIERDGERVVQRLDSGEEYAICCPVCHETRFRLNVNHVFGECVEGVEMRHVAHCWNDDCAVEEMLLRHYQEFCELMPDELAPVELERVDSAFSIEQIAAECRKNLLALPGVTRIDQLEDGHPAVRYLRGRNFDPAILGTRYGVGHCFNRDYSARPAHKRLIIPVLYQGQYVGWQARAIEGWTKLTLRPGAEDKPWPYAESKYWTSPGLRKSFFLYSYDLALTQDHVVVVEGPTDAWRAGAAGTAILGRRISAYQARLLADGWAERPGKIVLIGDPGFEADWRRNKDVLEAELREPGKVKLVVPRDRDPGSMGKDEIQGIIHEQCAS